MAKIHTRLECRTDDQINLTGTLQMQPKKYVGKKFQAKIRFVILTMLALLK